MGAIFYYQLLIHHLSNMQSASSTMMIIIASTIIILAFGSLVITAQNVRYDNYQVHSVRIDTEDQRNAISHLENGEMSFFWKGNNQPGDWSDVMVSPAKSSAFKDLVNRFAITSTLKVANVQE